MPEPTGRGRREFLDSANQALSELEEATGKPVLIVEAPELKVLATIRRAGPEDSSHVLRIQGGENRAADYLIVLTGHRLTGALTRCCSRLGCPCGVRCCRTGADKQKPKRLGGRPIEQPLRRWPAPIGSWSLRFIGPLAPPPEAAG